MSATSAVTGAFGYTGRHIARALLARGESVLTLTGNPGRTNDLGPRVTAAPFRFDRPELMAASLDGIRVLYNTYWVRFDRGHATHERAVGNTLSLLEAARMAGVRRIVHIGITNPREDSPLPYFRGKARIERAIRESGLGYAILRPTVLFGTGDILINNIAWLLRHMPVFLIPGSGEYRLQPVSVEDAAQLAVDAADRPGDLVMDAVGPETFSFEELVRLVRGAVGSRAALLHAPPSVALLAARTMGALLGDVVLTRDEVEGLMANLLVSAAPPTCPTRLSDWVARHSAALGVTYASELARHYGR